MPSGSPFTRLCQSIALHSDRDRADLHIHSTFSDGEFTPEEVIARAKKAGLTAVAITDHDTLAGFAQAKAAADSAIEVIPGVEITTTFQDRELHLLGYFVRVEDNDLVAALERLRQQRFARFEAIIERLRATGVSISDEGLQVLRSHTGTLGRRHLARLLIDNHQVRSFHEAFFHHLNTPEVLAIPKLRLPVAEAIALVRAAGGVSSWAHPASDASIEQMQQLQAFGLTAVECEYPWAKPSHGKKLRAMADELGLAVTGGSDCHGPQPNGRAIGVRGISRGELDRIKRMAC